MEANARKSTSSASSIHSPPYTRRLSSAVKVAETQNPSKAPATHERQLLKTKNAAATFKGPYGLWYTNAK